MTFPLSSADRREVARRGRYRCAYCQSQEQLVGAIFTIDHIIPQALGGNNDLDNLCLACWDCNRLKRTHVTGVKPLAGERVALFHPNRQGWAEHFAWADEGRYIVGLTPEGRATVEQLQLNRPILVSARVHWIVAGWHPPSK